MKDYHQKSLGNAVSNQTIETQGHKVYYKESSLWIFFFICLKKKKKKALMGYNFQK